jgi:hypothetical protein
MAFECERGTFDVLSDAKGVLRHLPHYLIGRILLGVRRILLGVQLLHELQEDAVRVGPTVAMSLLFRIMQQTLIQQCYCRRTVCVYVRVCVFERVRVCMCVFMRLCLL